MYKVHPVPTTYPSVSTPSVLHVEVAWSQYRQLAAALDLVDAASTEGDIQSRPVCGGIKMDAVNVNVNAKVNVHELRLGFSNTTRSPEGLLSHNNRERQPRHCYDSPLTHGNTKVHGHGVGGGRDVGEPQPGPRPRAKQRELHDGA
jgi:hypothetical protein